MSGYFKLVDAHDGAFRIKLISGEGALMAVSAMFPTKKAGTAIRSFSVKSLRVFTLGLLVSR